MGSGNPSAPTFLSYPINADVAPLPIHGESAIGPYVTLLRSAKSHHSMDADKILREMEKNGGEVCNPLILTSKIMPEWIPRQAEEGKFVMSLPNIPPKYKQLIMISVAAALQNKQCTEYFIKVGAHMGLSSKEIGEAILTARFAMASTIFSSAEEGFQSMIESEIK